jgi:RNA polymerase sigma-70 factor (ECF subfamily)
MPERAAQQSFAELHALHRERILGYLQRLTRDRAQAEDLTQETFLRVSRGLPGFRGESKLSTWLYRIATNVYLDRRRREASRPRESEALPEAGVASACAAPASAAGPGLPDRLLEASEMGSCLREFVDGLPAAYRAVIVLHDLEGLTSREISRVLDCSLDSVKIRLHRARRKLEAVLSEQCDFETSDQGLLHCDRKQSGPRR